MGLIASMQCKKENKEKTKYTNINTNQWTRNSVSLKIKILYTLLKISHQENNQMQLFPLSLDFQPSNIFFHIQFFFFIKLQLWLAKTIISAGKMPDKKQSSKTSQTPTYISCQQNVMTFFKRTQDFFISTDNFWCVLHHLSVRN